MKKVLGIDYGGSKLGLAVGDHDSKLAEPLMVIRYDDVDELLRKLVKIVDDYQIERVVVGMSEGKMADETNQFAHKLKNCLNIPVVLHDETLTTKDAIEKSIESGMKKSKRRQLEDAFSAAIMLQDYLEKILL